MIEHMTDLDLLESLADVESGLTAWELDRLEEWLPMVEAGGALTERHRATMERALERVECEPREEWR